MNPELQRHLWLELTPHRLVGAPLALALAFTLVWQSGSDTGLAALVLFGAAALWAQSRMVESVFAEVRDGTWDTQKLSALSPWSMAWGKLAGAGAFQWYICAICMAVFALANRLHPRADFALLAVLMALGAVLGQSLALLLALALVRRGVRSLSSLMALVSVLALTGIATSLFRGVDAAGWYGMTLSPQSFALASVATFAAWAVIGAWRAMCIELKVQTLPWAWLGFIAFLALYLNGLALPGSAALRGSALACTAALVLGYLAAFVEPREPIALMRWRLAMRAGDWLRVARDTPCWLLAIAGALALLPGALADGSGSGPMLLLYALRDIALLHVFSYAARAQRAEATTMLYLALLYWVIPGILDLAGAVSVSVLIRPPPDQSSLAGLAALLSQDVALWWLAAARWQRRVAIAAAA
ncbi:MAG: hypothetical protein AB7Q97_04795 [Gammaproteobacteria bacterium]